MRRVPAQHQDAARPQAKTRDLLDQLALLKAVRLSTVVFFEFFVLFPSRHGELEREYVVPIGRSSYNFLGSSWLFSHAKPLESSWGGNLRGFWTFKGRPLPESRVKRPQIEGLA